jgi:DNA-directed RNA polymerase specialized sigma24 family protein
LGKFREVPEHHLDGLSDERLIDYMRAAREAGRREAMKPAIAVLVYGYWDNLLSRARLKLADTDAEDVAAEAASSAIASAFDGRSVGEFRAWLHTILSRRIADYHEARKRRPRTTELPGEHTGDDDVWGSEPAVSFEGDALFAQQCLDRVYAELEDDRHRLVVDLYVYGPTSAADCAATVGHEMTEANVHQIASRFQRRFRELLEAGDTGGGR